MAATLEPAPTEAMRPPRESTRSWPLADRLLHLLCWLSGIVLCLFAAGIVIFMLVKGISYLRPSLLVTPPSPSLVERQTGGFSEPLIGTFIVAAIGILLAAPVGVGIATWLSEYGRPAPLARLVESALEMLAGAPSVVLAIFGLLLFSEDFLGFLSQRTAGGVVNGRSFFAAGAVMAVLALPLIVAATREALQQLPHGLREASFALGKTKASTIRHVLLPSIRPSIAGGVTLGLGRIIGDTAIITILLGSAPHFEAADNVPILGTLRGFGSTLTSYIYNESVAGEGNGPHKAYAAAFVLLLIVLVLNALVTRFTTVRRPRRRRLRRALAWSR